MGRFTNPTPQFFDDNGDPLVGGKLFFYENGTSTPQATYSDDALTVANSNPVILDSAGRAPNIYASADVEYRVVLKNSIDDIQWTRDDVQFSDAAELLALVTQLQDQIDNLEIVAVNQNPIRNCTAQVATNSAAATLSGTFQCGNLPFILSRVTGTVSAGTFLQNTSSLIGSTYAAAKCAGVTGDSSSVIQYAYRIGFKDALKFTTGTAWASALVRQESGVTATVTIALYSAVGFDDFSSVTLLGSTTTSLASSTNATITAEGIAMNSNAGYGIEVRISIAPGASFTTKDFYATDVQFGAGSVAQDFNPPTYAALRASTIATYPVLDAAGSVNVMTASVDEYLPALYDGLRVSVRANNTVTSVDPTLNLNGLGAVTIVKDDATALSLFDGEIPSGAVKDYVYRKASNKWQLMDPSPVELKAKAVWTATGNSMGRDMLGNVTLNSYSKDTGTNVVTYRFNFTNLPAITSSNFVVVASGFNCTWGIGTRVDDDTIQIIGFYPDNGGDVSDLDISATLYMSA